MFSLKIATIFVLLTLSQNSYSQDSVKVGEIQKKYLQSFQLAIENGAILGGGDNIFERTGNSSYFNGLDIRYGWTKANRQDTYNRIYRFPTLGIGYYNTAFHNSKIGIPSALYFFFTLPLSFNEDKKWIGSYTCAYGVSYNFDAEEERNNANYGIAGYYWKCYLNLSYNLSCQLSPKFAAYGSVGFKHFSNGSMWRPNHGINLFPISVGINYKFDRSTIEPSVKTVPSFIRHNQWNIIMAAASKNYVGRDPNYLKATLGLNYLRQISYKFRIGVGMDLFYSAGYDKRNPGKEADFSNSVSYAVVGCWEWVINKVVFVPINFGYYLHRTYENYEKASYYERIGIRFRFNKHYNAGVSIKAHDGAADIFEWTVAYTFHQDPNNYIMK